MLLHESVAHIVTRGTHGAQIEEDLHRMALGESGTGKSKYAYKQSILIGYFYWKNETIGWDGYEGQKLVVIDD